ncbi:hypothetical protein [Fibrella forsythiae]|uniref:Tetratricopeptide repeat protein n=1 Tax=Fibrella forsythiae TaxID=2817061 RepID=A0ABS3JT93_9BACT|nr:hypothetical protein [Fibrella forsythiae]MBO0953226.1 hypothetical protein [Fibrella forsythiae]
MKQYVPNLIAERYRVLPDYFKQGNTSQVEKVDSAGALLWNAGSIALLFAALMVIQVHQGFALALCIFAFLTSDWGKRLLERGLRFVFTSRLKAITLGAVGLLVVGTGIQYQGRVDQINEHLRLVMLANLQEQQAAQRRETQRLDSLRSYLTAAEALSNKGAYAKSIPLYRQATRFVTSKEPVQQRQVQLNLATAYARTKQYKLAIGTYNEMGALDGDMLYQQALCYQCIGRKSEALDNLRQASKAGHESSAQLYEKLNPLIRKVSYYQTVCCDGSYSPSNAKGSGACSHHGGVCNWNLPIYETYRKYEVNDF